MDRGQLKTLREVSTPNRSSLNPNPQTLNTEPQTVLFGYSTHVTLVMDDDSCHLVGFFAVPSVTDHHPQKLNPVP